jgi:PIN domain nuclease of toxin-antitoxin system
VTGPILLDTCALIWLAQGAPLSAAAADELAAAAEAGEPLTLSPISWWEIGLLSQRGRLSLTTAPSRWLAAFVGAAGARVAPLEPDILLDSSFLPGAPPPDPADRIVIATARAEGLRVMTRDRRILAYAAAGHVAAIPC